LALECTILYPAKLTPLNEYISYKYLKLPDKLPIHGLRVTNRMPQLGVVLDVEAIKVASGGKEFAWSRTGWTEGKTGITADDLAHTKYRQAYEPTTPYSVETGVMNEAPINCFMTMPEKGLKLFSLTLSDGTKKTVAILPMIGPYGNEPRFNCYNDILKESYQFHGKARIEMATSVKEYGISFHPETDTSGTSYTTWSDTVIQEYVDGADARTLTFGNYEEGPGRLYGVFKDYSPKGLKCLVVGSAPNPWVEGILLSFGATDITTSEYQVPHIPPGSKYSGWMKSIHHEELLANPVQFDMIVSFSSLEHDGLGRYHDPLSPGGDLQQLRNLYSLLKPGGIFVLEVPLGLPGSKAGAEQDSIRVPLDREYGPVRYIELIKLFQLEGIYGTGEKVFKEGTEPGIGGVNKLKTLVASREYGMRQNPSWMHGVSVCRKPAS